VVYSSASNFPSVVLWRSGLAFFATTSCDAFGLPTRSRAISFKTLAAEKTFFFRLRAIAASSHIRSRKSAIIGTSVRSRPSRILEPRGSLAVRRIIKTARPL